MTSAFSEPPDTSVIVIRRAGGTIVVRPAPRREPPYDDELATAAAPVGPHDRPLPFERPTRRTLPAPVAARTTLPDPALWGRRLLVGIIEAAAGRRPLTQVAPLLTPMVANGLRAEFERAAAQRHPHWTGAAAIRSLRASMPSPDVAELSATLRLGERVRAAALRLEACNDRWCCTRLVLG